MIKKSEQNIAKKWKHKFYCDQDLIKRTQPDGMVRLLWILHRLSDGVNFTKMNNTPVYQNHFLNLDKQQYPTHIQHFVESAVFETNKGCSWKIRFMAFQPSIDGKYYPARFCIFAIPNIQEKQQKRVDRIIEIQIGLLNTHKGYYKQNNCSKIRLVLKGDPTSKNPIFQHFTMPLKLNIQKMDRLGLSDLMILQIEISHCLSQNEKSNYVKQYRGIVNEGTTCYLNSLIQTLFMNQSFRHAIYQIPIQSQTHNNQNLDTETENFTQALQRIFFNLQSIPEEKKYQKVPDEQNNQLDSLSPVRTHELLNAFGWNGQQRNEQQDVSEFNCMLSDQLEKVMQATGSENTYAKLFQGQIQNVISCINLDYESCRNEVFNTLQLTLQGQTTIQDSIRDYIAEELLTDDNMYQTDKHGKQDAKKYIRFKKFPPVLQISLNRFDFDFRTGNMAKFNQALQFEEVLDFETILPGKKQNSNSQSQQTSTNNQRGSDSQQSEQNKNRMNRYHLHAILIHSGTLSSGHYYAYIKPSFKNQSVDSDSAPWYEFNDSDVTQVTTHQALMEGIGGESTQFRLETDINGNHCIKMSYHENQTNAYMLIYVREHDRQLILSDRSVSEVPTNLYNKFQLEHFKRDTIQKDFEKLNNYHTCYLLTSQTLVLNNWNGLMISQPLAHNSTTKRKNKHFGNQCNFLENSSHGCMKLLVDQRMSVMQFILQLKRTLFVHVDEVRIQDIWLYRIANQNNNNCDTQILHQKLFDYQKQDDMPLFCKNPQLNRDHFQNLDSNINLDQFRNYFDERKQWNYQTKTVYFYIMINPDKKQYVQNFLNPLCPDSYETQKIQQYIQTLRDYIQQSDMGRGLQDIYDNFNFNYLFANHKIDFQEMESDGLSKLESYKDFSQQLRSNIFFDFDPKLEEQLLNNQLLIYDKEETSIQQISSPNHRFGILFFIKEIHEAKQLEFKTEAFLSNFDEMLKTIKSIILPSDTADKDQIIRAFVEPNSMQALNLDYLQQISGEQSGIIYHQSNHEIQTYQPYCEIRIQDIQNDIQFEKLFNKNGIILNIMKTGGSFNIKNRQIQNQENQIIMKQLLQGINKSYQKLLVYLENKVEVELIEILEDYNSDDQNYLGQVISKQGTQKLFRSHSFHQFNYLNTLDEITDLICQVCNQNSKIQSNSSNQSEIQSQISELQMEYNSKNIQLFDKNDVAICHNRLITEFQQEDGNLASVLKQLLAKESEPGRVGQTLRLRFRKLKGITIDDTSKSGIVSFVIANFPQEEGQYSQLIGQIVNVQNNWNCCEMIKQVNQAEKTNTHRQNIDELLYLALIIDRETGFVNKIINQHDQELFQDRIVQITKQKAYEKTESYLMLWQIQQNDQKSLQQSREAQNSEPLIVFVQIYDIQRPYQSRYGHQVACFFDYQTSTFQDLYEYIDEKLKYIIPGYLIQSENNQSDLQFEMRLINFHFKQAAPGTHMNLRKRNQIGNNIYRRSEFSVNYAQPVVDYTSGQPDLMISEQNFKQKLKVVLDPENKIYGKQQRQIMNEGSLYKFFHIAAILDLKDFDLEIQ